MNEKTDQPYSPLLEHIGIMKDSLKMLSGRMDNIQKIFTERIEGIHRRLQKLESAAASRPPVDVG